MNDRCPHCGKRVESEGDGGIVAALVLVGLFIAYGIAYANGWVG